MLPLPSRPRLRPFATVLRAATTAAAVLALTIAAMPTLHAAPKPPAEAPAPPNPALGDLDALAAARSTTLKPLVLGPAALLPPADAPAVGEGYDVASAPPAAWFGVLPGQTEGPLHRLWSAWGDATWAENGKVYAAIGDHGTPFGTSYVYELDPATKAVKLVVDVNAVVGLTDPKLYAPGKIHAPLVAPGDGWLYLATYRGSIRQTGPETGYVGDWLLRYSLTDGTIENLGVMVPYTSPVVMEYHAASNCLYGLAVFGATMPEPQEEKFFVYSLTEKKLRVSIKSPSPMNRAMFLAADGTAYVDGPDSELFSWKPGDAAFSPTGLKVPGGKGLRAAAPPTPAGVLHGMGKAGELFAFDPTAARDGAAAGQATGTLEELGAHLPFGPGYTAVIRRTPDLSGLYYVPAAHGRSREAGTPLVRYDIATRRPTVLAFLHDPVAAALGYNLGGTYSLALSPDGTQLCILFNGGLVGRPKNDFGLCSLLLLDLSALRAQP